MKVLLLGYDCPYCKVIHIMRGEWTTEAEMQFAKAREQYGEVPPFREAFMGELGEQIERLFKESHKAWEVFDTTKLIRDQKKLNLAQNIYDIRRNAHNN